MWRRGCWTLRPSGQTHLLFLMQQRQQKAPCLCRWTAAYATFSSVAVPEKAANYSQFSPGLPAISQPLPPRPFFFPFFFLCWQPIRRLRLSAAPSQRTGRNLLLGKSNTSVRLTLRPHQSEEPVIFLHPGRPVRIHLPQRQVKCGSVNKLAALRWCISEAREGHATHVCPS